MGDLVEGDDGLPAEDVGPWAKEKHELLCRYVDISRSVRKKFIGPGKGGATYIDLFCGPGRARVRGREFIDGSCVAAWRKSVEGGAPFSQVLIADLDQERLDAAVSRLQDAGAPVTAFHGPAVETARRIVDRLSVHSLHFAFLDPFSLGALDFRIFHMLAQRKRMDVIVHLSKMDLQRNLGRNIAAETSAFDTFAPGWRQAITTVQGQRGIRIELIEYWREIVSNVGFAASPHMRLLKGPKEQHLYWLLLVASHGLAHRFWQIASNPGGQGEMF
ncbi:three-Cys-motif partner protein TcmP [Xanthobacter versatilis]|uniref:three-Cys-motif partner protein TcmP n=1 Tax=Xanthobacter autotrophicus (strain ATCC BAA-1158 / Py2) TaxID=78245 RepID=UPI003729D98A